MPRLFLFFLLFLPAVLEAAEPFDFLIKKATVYDGSGNASFKADVAIRGDRILKVAPAILGESQRVIYADDFILSPGFIDTHTHSDFNPWSYPFLENKITQGVTTEVVGNCGMSAAPISGSHSKKIHKIWAREGVRIPTELEWKSFSGYKQAFEARSYTNFVGLVGHGNLRNAVMGSDTSEALDVQINAMRTLLRAALKEGARGLSFGLVYLPGIFASEKEILELCKEVAKVDGVCTFHMRSEGRRLVEAVGEVLRIAEKADVRVQISHLKAGGRDNWPKIAQVLELINEAQKKGLQVGADVYPYTAGFAELAVTLPDKYYRRPDRTRFFQNPANHDEVVEALKKRYAKQPTKWESIVVATIPSGQFSEYEGLSLQRIAYMEGKHPARILVELLVATNFQASAFYFTQSPQVVEQVIKHTHTSIGSDSIADGSSTPHPRAFGTFPKLIRESYAGYNDLKIEAMIHKMTGLAAKQFGLKDRGFVKETYFADLLLWKAEEVHDRADYSSPAQLSQGMQWVFINGVPVIKEGRIERDALVGRMV